MIYNNEDDCVTPMNKCYNGQILFPNDLLWGNYNIYDQWNDQTVLILTIPIIK